MKKQLVILSLSAVALLAGCGQGLTTMGTAISSNGSQSTQSATPANQMLSQLEADLRSGTVGTSTSTVSQKAVITKISLSEAQINTILATADMALQAAGLGQSTDLKSLISTLISGASTGVGALQLSDPAVIAKLVSLIGNSTLTSIVNQSTTSVSTSLLEQVANSVFSNLKNAGMPTGNISGSASTIINSIVSNLASTDLHESGFADILKSLASGAVAGIGKLNLGSSSSTIVNAVLSNLGSGSSSGISSLIASLGLTGTGASSTVTSLVNAFAAGANTALQGWISSGKTSSTIGTLLSAVLSGLAGSSSAAPAAAAGTGGSASTGSTLVSSVITSVVGALLANLGK